MQLSKEFIKQIEEKIIPHIVEAVKDGCRAFEQSEHFDNYLFGCACWNSLFNRINLALINDDYFNIETYSKVTKISVCNNGKIINFYVTKVDEYTRVPKAGKSIKLNAGEQDFLSKEIEEIICQSSTAVYILGYSASTEHGLGKITFDILSTTDKKHFQATTLHTFEYEKDELVELIPLEIEEIPQPIVTREELPNFQKEVNK